MFQTPILLLVFNRPDLSAKVMAEIRKQAPTHLFIAADGPRTDNLLDAKLCRQTRETVLDNIDWPCEVRTLLRTENLGCGKAVSSALYWFFDQVEEGIVLEDDCLPDSSFFSFCSVLLERYRNHPGVMHISGDNFQQGKVRGDGSYYFSRLSHIWGWASWRRAWQQYDFTLQSFRNRDHNALPFGLRDQLDRIYDQSVDTWDIQWFMTVWFSGGMAVVPNITLVRNIGYDKQATHTRRVPRWFHRIRYGSLGTLRHPSIMRVDKEADDFTISTVHASNPLRKLARKFFKRKL